MKGQDKAPGYPGDGLAQVTEFLGAMSNMVNVVGIPRSIEIMKLGAKGSVFSMEDLNIACFAVAKVFSIQQFQVFKGGRKYPGRYAFAMWTYLANKKLNYRITELKPYAQKKESALWRANALIKQIIEKKEKSTFDLKLIQKLDKAIDIIDEKIKK
jgi:hypothetical protein